jgi:hypothetical protein
MFLVQRAIEPAFVFHAGWEHILPEGGNSVTWLVTDRSCSRSLGAKDRRHLRDVAGLPQRRAVLPN